MLNICVVEGLSLNPDGRARLVENETNTEFKKCSAAGKEFRARFTE